MDIDRFVPVNPNDREMLSDLTCPLCNKIIICAMRCADDHNFCRSCIKTALQITPACPVDKSELTTRDLLPNKFIDRLVSRLAVRCENADTPAMIFAVRRRLAHPTGCRWAGSFGELEEHLKVCGFRGVQCDSCGRDDIPELGLASHARVCRDRYVSCELCEGPVLAKEMDSHLNECPAANVYCPNHCLLIPGRSNDVLLVRRSELSAHLKVCPKQMVTCEFRDVGCRYRGFKEAIPAHMERAVSSHMLGMKRGLMKAQVSMAKDLAETKAAMKDMSAVLGDSMKEFGESERDLEVKRMRDEVTERRFKSRRLMGDVDEDGDEPEY